MQELVYIAPPWLFKLLVGGSMLALGTMATFIIVMLIREMKKESTW